MSEQTYSRLKEVGTIISTFTTPTSSDFKFLMTQPVKKDQFVQFETEEGVAIARLTEVRKTNRYFMQAESVKDYEQDGYTLDTIFPTKEWEYLVADGLILGVYDTEGQKRPTFPPSPGIKVFMVDEELLGRFLGLDLEKGVNFGNVLFQDIPASLNIERLLRKHLAVLAKSGAGKSYFASVLLEELLDRAAEESVAVVVVDPHGEYVGFAQDKQYMSRVKVVSSEEIQFNSRSLNISFFSRMYDLKGAQARELEKILEKLKNERPSFDLYDVAKVISESEIKNATTKGILTHYVESAKSLGLFKKYDSPSLQDIEAGKMIILDLSDSVSNTKKQVIVDRIASQLFYARLGEKIPPFFLLVEEAHNFAPEQASKSEALARGIIIKIAREGRKFGASLGLISQRPVNLSTTALSQCNTHIFLRVTNPYDLKHIEESSEGITPDVRKSIPGLRVGDCIVVGEAVNYPIFVRVKQKKSIDLKSGTITDLTKDFLANKKQFSDDAGAFI